MLLLNGLPFRAVDVQHFVAPTTEPGAALLEYQLTALAAPPTLAEATLTLKYEERVYETRMVSVVADQTGKMTMMVSLVGALPLQLRS